MNARTRRAAHLERARALRERKRLRRQRAEMHRAMTEARLAVEQRPSFTPPFRCEQSKREDGWHVLDADGKSAGVAMSRTAQRTMRDDLNGGAA